MHDHTYAQAYADWQAELRAADRRCHDEGTDDGRGRRAWRWPAGRRTHGGPPVGDGGPSSGG